MEFGNQSFDKLGIDGELLSNHQGIKCRTFWDAEKVINKAETKIKVAKSNKERRYYAQDILIEIETLLLCANFNDGNPDCVSCYSILRRYIKEYENLANHKRSEPGIINGSHPNHLPRSML